MNRALKFSVRGDAVLAAGPQMPPLYRSEAFAEDILDLYPTPETRLQPQRSLYRTVLAAAWAASLVLATVVVIHSTLA